LVEGSWTDGYFSTGQMACADLFGESLVLFIGKFGLLVCSIYRWQKCISLQSCWGVRITANS
ncbi:hypothetical protein CJF35_22515, partial [Pseudomonas lundensis]